jgi:predicted transcriptional regulator
MAIETDQVKLRLGRSLIDSLEVVDQTSLAEVRAEMAAVLAETRTRWRDLLRHFELLIETLPSADAGETLERFEHSAQEGTAGDEDIDQLSTTLAQLILSLRLDALEDFHDQLQYRLARWREQIPELSAEISPLVLATRRVLERAVTEADLRLVLGSEQAADVLRALVAEPGLTTADMANRLNVHVSAISRTGRQLLDCELVYTRAIGRHHVWELTPRGEAVLAAVSHQLDPSIARRKSSGIRRLERALAFEAPSDMEREPDIINAAAAIIGDSLFAADVDELHQITSLLKERSDPGLRGLLALTSSGEAVLRGAVDEIQLEAKSVDILSLLQSGYWTTAQLCQATGLADTTLRNLAGDLERGGALARIDVGRSKPWRITPIGLAVCDAVSEVSEQDPAAVALQYVGTMIRDAPRVHSEGGAVLVQTFDAVRIELVGDLVTVGPDEGALPSLDTYRVGAELIDSSQTQLLALGPVSAGAAYAIGKPRSD